MSVILENSLCPPLITECQFCSCFTPTNQGWLCVVGTHMNGIMQHRLIGGLLPYSTNTSTCVLWFSASPPRLFWWVMLHCINYNLFTCVLLDRPLAAFTAGLQWTQPQQTFLHKSLGSHVISFLLDEQWEELQDQKECLVFGGFLILTIVVGV
jgi:hypothetical protein